MSFITDFSSWAYEGRPPSFRGRIAWFFLLWPLSQLYGLALHLRHVKSKKLPIRVISVGSITVGGAGKSPVTAYLARYLMDKGYKVAILSRGYRRKSRELVVVSDGQGVINPAVTMTGDEPLMLARQLAGRAVVLACPDRYTAGLKAVEMGCQVAILDDGAQHRQLARDVDFILLDPRRPLGNGYLLPAGPLRDLPSRINEAGVLWYYRNGGPAVGVKAAPADQPAIYSQSRLTGVRLAADGQPITVAGAKILAFCGLARPGNFFTALKALNCSEVVPIIFADHHAYCRNDLAEVARQAAAAGCQYVVTTQKDLVKIESQWWPGPLPLCFAPLEVILDEGSQQCLKQLLW